MHYKTMYILSSSEQKLREYYRHSNYAPRGLEGKTPMEAINKMLKVHMGTGDRNSMQEQRLFKVTFLPARSDIEYTVWRRGANCPLPAGVVSISYDSVQYGPLPEHGVKWGQGFDTIAQAIYGGSSCSAETYINSTFTIIGRSVLCNADILINEVNLPENL